jgi:hypothetical protein
MSCSIRNLHLNLILHHGGQAASKAYDMVAAHVKTILDMQGTQGLATSPEGEGNYFTCQMCKTMPTLIFTHVQVAGVGREDPCNPIQEGKILVPDSDPISESESEQESNSSESIEDEHLHISHSQQIHIQEQEPTVFQSLLRQLNTSTKIHLPLSVSIWKSQDLIQM